MMKSIKKFSKTSLPEPPIRPYCLQMRREGLIVTIDCSVRVKAISFRIKF